MGKNDGKIGGADSKVLVSICIISYKSPLYLFECLRSILTFENLSLNFDIEVIIGDDLSTNETKDVIYHFAKKYPSIIKYIFHETNIGAAKNIISVHSQAIGKYVCHIDGDDLFLPNKIYKQVEFLENNPTLSFCCHQCIVFDDQRGISTPMLDMRSNYLNKIIKLRDYLSYSSSPIVHSSIMYKRESWKLHNVDFDFIDWFVIASLLKEGDGYYLSDVLGEYRKNKSGSTMTSNKRNVIKVNMLKADLIYKFYCSLENKSEYSSFLSNNIFSMFIRELLSLRFESCGKYFVLLFKVGRMPSLKKVLMERHEYISSLNHSWVSYFKKKR